MNWNYWLYWTGILIKNLKWQKREPDPFTLEEIDSILASMREDFHPSVANYFEFAFFTGLRPSELIEVKWSDVNNLSITVRRAKVENQVKDTKTYKVRDVLLNQRALDALRRQSSYKHISSEYIFFNPETRSQWNCDKSQNITFWIPTLQKLGVRHRVPYQTRHTFATILLVKGINPMWVSKQMGHVNMKMLLEVYAKWIDLGDKSKEIDRVNNALFSTNFVLK